MALDHDTDLLTVREAAGLLKVSAVTLHRWLKQGRLPAQRVGPKAIRIRRRDLASVIAPPQMAGEVANALYQKVRSRDPDRHLTGEEAQEALTAFMAVQVESLSPNGMYELAMEFALEHGLPSLYDSLYVVLARLLGVELWTADRRLLDALGGGSPWVRFIGDYPLL